ncbi:zona pellucida-like domain-containing protein [Ditylenchus destructor]|uniref:Zona pellucida-like domain-containing protein n=1 Tax=Ditylenchus destructor TaxID=166010 RepID=A0AAD4R7Y8_9BILA|nr:zona pellucida-like domain-containing protein [Ditylenchus destructor]
MHLGFCDPARILLLYVEISIALLALMDIVTCMENGVIGEPRVDCGVESINVWIRTEKQFQGRLYVEEESEHPECVHSYGKDGGSYNDGYESRGAEFSIRFGQCNMRRQRVLNPRGVSYSFTLVISFHPVFLTGVDKAFNIKCFFLEAVKAVDVSLDVSPLTTLLVEQEFALPQCTYHLKQGPQGTFLKYANIGEPITHVWSCDASAGLVYGVLIHSCFVDDGRGNRFDLVDERGCAIDKYLLNDIVYDEKGLGAFANTHVFRYADRIQLFFTCTLQLCFKEDGGCKGITPPLCTDSGKSIGPFSPGPQEPPKILPPHSHRHGIELPVPPGVSPQRNALRKLVRRPNAERFPQGPFPSVPEFLSHPFGNPFKDSPLGILDNDTDSDINNFTRSSREAPLSRMETDLSADLTVLPLHQTISAFDSEPFKRVNNATETKHQCFTKLSLLPLLIGFLVTVFVSSLVSIFCVLRRKDSHNPWAKGPLSRWRH